jgi:hypothetical protein
MKMSALNAIIQIQKYNVITLRLTLDPDPRMLFAAISIRTSAATDNQKSQHFDRNTQK